MEEALILQKQLRNPRKKNKMENGRSTALSV